jgi:hypothetical protein
LYGRTADELNGIAPASLAVYRNTPIPSDTWVLAASGAFGTSGEYSYAEGQVAGFSPFLLGEGGQVPTAVTNLQAGATSAKNNWRLVGLLVALLGVGTAVLLHRRPARSLTFPKS